jgi:hypothetical protein
LSNFRVTFNVVGTFPVTPHPGNVVITSQFVTTLLATVNVSTVDPIAKGIGRGDSYVVDIAKMVRQPVHIGSLGQIINFPEFLVRQFAQAFFRRQGPFALKNNTEIVRPAESKPRNIASQR